MNLQAKVGEGSRSLKTYAKRLEKLGIYTYKDLLYHIPSRYIDYSIISPIASLQEGEQVTVQGIIKDTKNTYTRSRKTIQKVTLADGTGELDITWFNQPYIIKNLTEKDNLSVSGQIERFGKKLTIISPEYEILTGQTVHTGKIIAVYPETRGVSSRFLRKQIALLFSDLDTVEDYLPEEIKKDRNLPDLITALRNIHFPKHMDDSAAGRKRLAFDEIFTLQLLALWRKKQWQIQKTSAAFTISQEDLGQFIRNLPFVLTPSQRTALDDIQGDMEKTQPMNRLLQGDVGSGKTVVAALGMFIAHKNNYQSALMAPTEILAQQHYKTLSQFLHPFGITVGLATSSHKLDPKNTYDVVVGTHALVARSVAFETLGFVVIDEQQRFGVEQRGILREKGINPHLLTMTATPIPRTVALTLYGELDVSYLTDMPKGRKTIKTWLVPNDKRDGAYGWIQKEIQTHQSQVFIICPFIEESENMQTVKAATKEFARLRGDIFPNLRLGMLHGKLKAKEKDEILTEFRNKKFDILVATPVVEVGIDIPNATIILIEGAERFGLAQLHQLRGRVGRGDKQSYCLLFTDATNPSSVTRLKAMETMSQGSRLAEFDLQMRGPGEIYGTKQSGTRMLKIASFSDIALLDDAKRAAIQTYQKLSEYPTLKKMILTQTDRTIFPD